MAHGHDDDDESATSSSTKVVVLAYNIIRPCPTTTMMHDIFLCDVRKYLCMFLFFVCLFVCLYKPTLFFIVKKVVHQTW